MYDINFFAPYQKQSVTANPMFRRWAFVGVVAVGTLAVLHLVGFGLGLWAKAEVNRYGDLLADKATTEMVEKIAKMNSDIEILTKHNGLLKSETAKLEASRVICPSLLCSVRSTVPQPIEFSSMTINMNEMNIVCRSPIAVNAAELEHNLLKLDCIAKVHIDSIAKLATDASTYDVVIKCDLEGVKTDDGLSEEN